MIELYELSGCPYCARVRETLDDLDIEYITHEVPSAHADRASVRELSGQTGVPVIVDERHGIDGMSESVDIVEYLEDTYG